MATVDTEVPGGPKKCIQNNNTYINFSLYVPSDSSPSYTKLHSKSFKNPLSFVIYSIVKALAESYDIVSKEISNTFFFLASPLFVLISLVVIFKFF